MSETENPAGASGQGDGQGTQASPPGTGTTPKLEVKDGAMLIDGKKVVFESDLIAAKKSLEKQLEEAQAVHNTAIDKARLDLSAAQTQVAAANAKVKELEDARLAGAASAEEAAKQKADLEKAKTDAATAATTALEMRKRNMLLQYPGLVTEEQLKDKTPEKLDALDEALKAVATSRGGSPGSYAVGGGNAGAVPMDDMERARAVLAGTPYRGYREPSK
jgi:hypothetical protein